MLIMAKAATTAPGSKGPKKTKNGAELKLFETIDEKADAKARDAILGARISLVLKHGFFGQLAMRLKLVNADKWLHTAATDGRHFYYNSYFINLLDKKQMVFLFCHELLHCAYNHIGRLGDRSRDLANIAMDYCVNADCVKHKLGEQITVVPILYDKQYEDMSYEQVYETLAKNANKINIQDLLDQLLDEHLEPDDGKGDGDDQKDGKGKNGNGRPRFSKEELEEIRNEFKEAMLSAAQNSQAGDLPGGLQRLLNDLTEPKINWRELIAQQIQATVKNDYWYQRPNKKGFSNGFTLPSMKKMDAIEVHVAIDTSGSIGEEKLNDFFSEVKGIMDSYDDYKIHIWCFDTSVHNPQVFSMQDGDDFLTYEPAGFGGTSFECNWRYMQDEEIEPKLLIVFTDGEPYGSWGDPDYCETIWIIDNNYNKNIKPPFGTWAYYEEDGLDEVNRD